MISQVENRFCIDLKSRWWRKSCLRKHIFTYLICKGGSREIKKTLKAHFYTLSEFLLNSRLPWLEIFAIVSHKKSSSQFSLLESCHWRKWRDTSEMFHQGKNDSRWKKYGTWKENDNSLCATSNKRRKFAGEEDENKGRKKLWKNTKNI